MQCKNSITRILKGAKCEHRAIFNQRYFIYKTHTLEEQQWKDSSRYKPYAIKNSWLTILYGTVSMYWTKSRKRILQCKWQIQCKNSYDFSRHQPHAMEEVFWLQVTYNVKIAEEDFYRVLVTYIKETSGKAFHKVQTAWNVKGSERNPQSASHMQCKKQKIATFRSHVL